VDLLVFLFGAGRFTDRGNCNDPCLTDLTEHLIQLIKNRRHIVKDEMCSHHTRLGAGGYIFL
jgi:hypothetical protein